MQISEWRLNKSRTTKNRSQSHYKKQDKHVRICTCKSCTLWDKSTRRCDECEKISERKIFAGFAGDKSSTVLDNVKIDTENGESLISIALFIINIVMARRELKQSRTFMCASFVSTFYHVSRNEFHVSEPKTRKILKHICGCCFYFKWTGWNLQSKAQKLRRTQVTLLCRSVWLFSQFGKDNIVAWAPRCDSFVQHSKLIRKYVVWVFFENGDHVIHVFVLLGLRQQTQDINVGKRSCDHRSNQRFAWLTRLPATFADKTTAQMNWRGQFYKQFVFCNKPVTVDDVLTIQTNDLIAGQHIKIIII